MDTRASKPAVILLSGGMDSAVVLAIAQEHGYACHALSVRYGQRHTSELDAADRVARALDAVSHKTVLVDLRSIGGSALTDAQIDVPLDSPQHPGGPAIPVTYVPARNTIMLSLALGWAEVLGAADIFCGVNAVDFSGYPDCRRSSSPRSSSWRTSRPRRGWKAPAFVSTRPCCTWARARSSVKACVLEWTSA